MVRTGVEGRSPSIFEAEIRSLPSGYTGLPRHFVEASQLQRLRHGVLMTVAERGYGPATVAQIAERAGVSKKTFYDHFPDKQSCLVAAYDFGRIALVQETITVALAAERAGTGPIGQMRHATGAYLDFMVREAAYAKVFVLEILSGGPVALDRCLQSNRDITGSVRSWHRKARRRYPSWPEVAEIAYEQATALVSGITLYRVAEDRTDELGELREPLVESLLAILRVPAGVPAPEPASAPGRD